MRCLRIHLALKNMNKKNTQTFSIGIWLCFQSIWVNQMILKLEHKIVFFLKLCKSMFKVNAPYWLKHVNCNLIYPLAYLIDDDVGGL